MTDRSKQMLRVYDKAGAKLAEGAQGTKDVQIPESNLKPDTTYNDGDFQVTYVEGTNESDKANVPGFKTAPATIAVAGVTMSQKTASMTVGATKQVTGNVNPENATDKLVTYVSSDEAVAKVAADGTITAVAPGTADITATTHDGGFSDKTTVTVTA